MSQGRSEEASLLLERDPGCGTKVHSRIVQLPAFSVNSLRASAYPRPFAAVLIPRFEVDPMFSVKALPAVLSVLCVPCMLPLQDPQEGPRPKGQRREIVELEDVPIVEDPIGDGTEGRAPACPVPATELSSLLRQRVVIPGLLEHGPERILAEQLRAEQDRGRMWSLTQGLRLRDHQHWGTVWCHDEEAERILAELVKADPDPVKRALAADALGDFAALRRIFLDRSQLEPVRAFAASLMPPPDGESERDARALLAAWWELLANEDEHVRAMAARAIGSWIFEELDQQRLLALGRSDPSALVRAELFETVVALGLPTARAYLLGVALDPEQPSGMRELARRAGAKLRIRAEG